MNYRRAENRQKLHISPAELLEQRIVLSVCREQNDRKQEQTVTEGAINSSLERFTNKCLKINIYSIPGSKNQFRIRCQYVFRKGVLQK
uniref:Uncharacterized protein n=1 Tax=Megaselia scalaris TaxID=36166 RepID=T1GBC0_MEGSC